MKIPDFIKVAFKDRVNLSVVILSLIIAITSFIVPVNWGGYVLFFVVITGAILRTGWWKNEYIKQLKKPLN